MVHRSTRGVTLRAAPLLALLLVAACGDDEELLSGPRYDVREFDTASDDFEKQMEAGGPATDQPPPTPNTVTPITPYGVTGETRALSLPVQVANANWTQINGGPTHQITHPALPNQLSLAWSVPIGEGNTLRKRITADPVVSGGLIFTMDSNSMVQAHTTQGQLVWQTDLTPTVERPGEAVGGGLAVEGSQLFVTTGYGALFALNVATGAQNWVQSLGSMPNSAPTVSGNIVYLTTRDSTAWAIDTRNGRVLWDLLASESGTVVVDGAAPAVTSRAVLFPFGSGDLVAALKVGGVRLWSTTVTGQRRGKAYAGIGDISSDPVVVGDTVYVGTPSGRLAAINAADGDRLWTAPFGASSAVWPAGGSLFLVSDQANLVRVAASTGEPIWSASLPLFTDEKIKKRKAVFTHYGPVLAGGRLIVVSDDGYMREIDPTSGALLRMSELPGAAAANPIVAGRTLYVVTADGTLSAFR
ncbi:PQQ-like beta-propeller repeat protein [Pseudoruegeria sp. SK021]|uniref:PQQ-like beta-propeller repeat protein n=1 Tax=Pseudoruegeria sp. SK021 TaxID=1933035 RepID=UPI000A265F9E|nr:PQQ-like beta-propeller repeat protein [Pseudoruegeria sp. SK021]OSP56283.1 hypothetical protein BV911_03055 [Pseudoruegeria sp. SK021]